MEQQRGYTMDNQQRKMESRLRWLGGFWDGEGTVTLTYRHKWRGKYSALAPNLSIVNTEKVLIDEVAAIFDELGLAYYRQLVPGYRPNRQERHSIIIAGMKRVVKTLPFLTPYLIGKKKGKAEKLMKFCASRLSLPPNSPYTQEQVELASGIREGKFDSKSLTDYTPNTTS